MSLYEGEVTENAVKLHAMGGTLIRTAAKKTGPLSFGGLFKYDDVNVLLMDYAYCNLEQNEQISFSGETARRTVYAYRFSAGDVRLVLG